MARACSVLMSGVFAAFFATGALALEVVYDKRTPQNLREWGDRHFVREQMEVLGEKICAALYAGEAREKLHETERIVLYLAPVKGGNPAFASGRRITWKVGENPGGDASGGMGLLCHEMTHILDMGSDRVFTEGMADWTRNYKVWYRRCTDPAAILDKRYRALRGARRYGKYMAGANFIDFMTQNYGEGTIYKILQGYKRHGRDPWQKTFGKDLDGLVAEWRTMETIYDPVFQWSYTGKAEGLVRHDKRFCALKRLAAAPAADHSGAWLDGATAGRVKAPADGSLALALAGRFPAAARPTVIAALGSATDEMGKAVFVASGPKRDTLTLCVVASAPGQPCAVVAKREMRVEALGTRLHALVLSVVRGETAVLSVDGGPDVRLDMRASCPGCAFAPVFAFGGPAAAGFAEARGEGGVLLADARVFTRAFRPRETKNYAGLFNASFRPAVAVTATWCGAPGGTAIDDPANWYCVNAAGERIAARPTEETSVFVSGRAIPCVPPQARLACRSFAIDGWALADEANIDLRGVRAVTASDNARLLTRKGRVFAVGRLKGRRLRLDGTLAVTGALALDGDLALAGGSVLRLPARAENARAASLSLSGDGTATLMPGAPPEAGRTARLMRLDVLPEDFSRFRLKAAAGAVFKGVQGKYLGVETKE